MFADTWTRGRAARAEPWKLNGTLQRVVFYWSESHWRFELMKIWPHSHFNNIPLVTGLRIDILVGREGLEARGSDRRWSPWFWWKCFWWTTVRWLRPTRSGGASKRCLDSGLEIELVRLPGTRYVTCSPPPTPPRHCQVQQRTSPAMQGAGRYSGAHVWPTKAELLE